VSLVWGRVTCLAVFGFALAGCYSLKPAGGVPPQVGTRVAFDVNDAGRVALGGTMGPEIAQVEGDLIEKDSASYLLSVHNVRLLRGGEQAWSGEQVRLKTEYVGYAYERHFSTGRSIAFGALGVGGFTAFMLTRSLLGFGSNDHEPPPDSIPARLGRP
jgi:hypothetical protein